MPPEAWCAKTADELKAFTIDCSVVSHEVFSATTGPGDGVEFVNGLHQQQDHINNNIRIKKRKSSSNGFYWSRDNRKACGICLSLYDKNPVTGKVSGDPIADCFAQIAKKNSSIMVIADGVNWGEKSKLAARCAVSGAVEYLNEALFVDIYAITTTKEALTHMRRAFDIAHNSILRHKGGLTTLNITVVLPIKDSSHLAVCSVNVGDSLTYVFSKRYGMNELSIGSHDINEERDIKDAGGAIGPVNGDLPYLTNLTFSVTTCEPGDIVFLTTDGISDNFDPVVTKIAVPGRKDSLPQSVDEKPEMLPHERHLFATKGMERVIHEYELEKELDISARELCTALTQHVVNLTSERRQVIENPVYYNRQYKTKERRKIEETIRNKVRTLPGKLDHATVVAYEAGLYLNESSPNAHEVTLSSSVSTMSISSYSTSNGSSAATPSSSMVFSPND